MPAPDTVGFDTQLQNLIDLAIDGDLSSKDALLAYAGERLLTLTRAMFRGFPSLHRWEQTDDVFQNSMIRLHRALMEVKVESVRHFFNLAGVQIRRELVDLGRKHFGPEGIGANHYSDGHPVDQKGGVLEERAEEPSDLEGWTEFHLRVENLPQAEREVFNLLYYEGLTQEEAAAVLDVSSRTLKRRWQSAKVRLHEELNREGSR